MGAASEMNYVELPRKPSEAEIAAIQMECNEKIRENIGITVETPDDVVGEKLPEDYDKEKGVVRVIRIGNLDANPFVTPSLLERGWLIRVIGAVGRISSRLPMFLSYCCIIRSLSAARTLGCTSLLEIELLTWLLLRSTPYAWLEASCQLEALQIKYSMQ